MSEIISVDSLRVQLKNLIICKDEVNIFNPEYERFASDLRKFIYENNFDDTIEWKRISNNLPCKSNQYMNRQEADTILVALEYLHRRLLMQENEIFWTYLHPLVIGTSKQLFVDKHYANAVQSAFVEINDRVKKIRKKIDGNELDGTDLMRKTFGTEPPKLLFEDNSTESGKNVQQGFMGIFAGVMQGIRNPNAHENIEISKDDAVRQLMLASLLMYKVDAAVRFSNIIE